MPLGLPQDQVSNTINIISQVKWYYYHTGLLEEFQKCNALLDEIQKCLEDYLESKRMQFPRYNSV